MLQGHLWVLSSGLSGKQPRNDVDYIETEPLGESEWKGTIFTPLSTYLFTLSSGNDPDTYYCPHVSCVCVLALSPKILHLGLPASLSIFFHLCGVVVRVHSTAQIIYSGDDLGSNFQHSGLPFPPRAVQFT